MSRVYVTGCAFKSGVSERRDMSQAMFKSIPIVTESAFEHEVLTCDLPVMVDFMSTRCGPCKNMAPEFEELAHDLEGRAKVVKVDVDQSRSLAAQLRIQSVPTTMVFVGGRLATGKIGQLRKEQLRSLIEPFLPRAQGSVSPIEASQLLAQRRIVLVDTREQAVFSRSHLPLAVSMPLDGIKGRLAELHMLQGFPVLYCRSGDKSKALAEELAKDGIGVAFLEGGVLGWESEGFPVERPD